MFNSTQFAPDTIKDSYLHNSTLHNKNHYKVLSKYIVNYKINKFKNSYLYHVEHINKMR